MKGKRLDWFNICNYTFLGAFCLLTIYPIWFVLIGSFNDGADYMRGGVYWFTRDFSLSSYSIVLQDDRLYTGFKVTILRTVLGTLISVFFTSMVAYAMSRRNLIGRSPYYWFFLFTLFFNGGLIPTFLVFKTLGLIDTFWVLIVPTMYSVFNMIIFNAFFRELPEEIPESAKVDGASDFKIFLLLFIPLSAPVLATVSLWNAVFHWNAFFDAMIFTTDRDLMPLQLYLMKMIREADVISNSQYIPPQVKQTISVQTIRMAAIVISTVPILLVYPFLQRYFVTGFMVGSLKG
ncbi:carbohydrate ABC transporter permease [Paenibacillus sp. J5C_2022]|uniref:carbohydrate ABC transporter permease n=1 Tax=Paenibacillus sp. J5C2022 TaxID=2977129 RepID=UPI0021D016F1|nr:carbohydrate ABC transporter permease [Paenibacillus sp. J5C2022]MCU6707726.1 carbohydrate ABC transporter permease [Paenibacillus sp. J5C2022]